MFHLSLCEQSFNLTLRCVLHCSTHAGGLTSQKALMKNIDTANDEMGFSQPHADDLLAEMLRLERLSADSLETNIGTIQYNGTI